jgi:hypothetical protein
MAKKKKPSIHKLTGEVFLSNKTKVRFFTKDHWGQRVENVITITASQARLLLMEDNPENYPLEEGW